MKMKQDVTTFMSAAVYDFAVNKPDTISPVHMTYGRVILSYSMPRKPDNDRRAINSNCPSI